MLTRFTVVRKFTRLAQLFVSADYCTRGAAINCWKILDIPNKTVFVGTVLIGMPSRYFETSKGNINTSRKIIIFTLIHVG